MRLGVTRLLITISFCVGDASFATAQLKTCGDPGQPCTTAIVDLIKDAKPDSDLRVQLYYLTSQPIIDALSDAKLNRVKVRIMIGKGMEQYDRCSEINKLRSRSFEVRVSEEMKITNKQVRGFVISRDNLIDGNFNAAEPPDILSKGTLTISDNRPRVGKLCPKMGVALENISRV